MRDSVIDNIYKKASQISGAGFCGAYESLIVDEELYCTDKNNSREPLIRWNFIEINDIQDKVILDLGCNIGGMCIESVLRGAKHCIGIDINSNIIKLAKELSNYLGMQNITYIQMDLEKSYIPVLADTIFMFSIIGHIYNKTNLLHYLENMEFKTMYFEGHPRESEHKYDSLFKELSLRYTYLGRTDTNMKEPNERPFFRCQK